MVDMVDDERTQEDLSYEHNPYESGGDDHLLEQIAHEGPYDTSLTFHLQEGQELDEGTRNMLESLGHDVKSFFVSLTTPEADKDWKKLLFKFFMPFVFAVMGIGIFYLSMVAAAKGDVDIGGAKFTHLFTHMSLYFLPPLGKESIIPLYLVGTNATQMDLGSLQDSLIGQPDLIFGPFVEATLICVAITFIDMVVCVFLAWNFDLIKKIPLLGTLFKRTEAKIQKAMEAKPWMEKLSLTGLALFVVVPFQGSGAVGATILGRGLGIQPTQIMKAVFVGTFGGTMFMAWGITGAVLLGSLLSLSQGIVVIALIIIFVELTIAYKKHWISPAELKKMLSGLSNVDDTPYDPKYQTPFWVERSDVQRFLKMFQLKKSDQKAEVKEEPTVDTKESTGPGEDKSSDDEKGKSDTLSDEERDAMNESPY